MNAVVKESMIMARPRIPIRPKDFQPSAEQRATWPAGISGNAINGLGEAEFRRPRRIYWTDPREIPHGEMMMWFLGKCNREVPGTADLYNRHGGRGPRERAPIAATRVERSPAQWAAAVRAFALAHETDQLGIAAMRADWVYEGRDGFATEAPWIIMLAVAMDQDELAKAPEPESVTEVMRQYNRGARAARALADWIRNQGYRAEDDSGPRCGDVAMIPPALEAGLGELGKHGSIINRRFGASFRLAYVLTDMPLAADRPDRFGAEKFCMNCQLCTRLCPVNAITPDKQMVRGARKWYVDFDKCITYFVESYGCGMCIAACPWSHPGQAPRLAETWSKRVD